MIAKKLLFGKIFCKNVFMGVAEKIWKPGLRGFPSQPGCCSLDVLMQKMDSRVKRTNVSNSSSAV